MEEKTQAETYLGYDLVLTAQEMSRGWSWGYLIDGGIRGINRFGTEMPDAEAALGRAMRAAHAKVDLLGAKQR